MEYLSALAVNNPVETVADPVGLTLKIVAVSCACEGMQRQKNAAPTHNAEAFTSIKDAIFPNLPFTNC